MLELKLQNFTKTGLPSMGPHYGSMGASYISLVLHLVDLYGKCREMYQSDGCHGQWHDRTTNFSVFVAASLASMPGSSADPSNRWVPKFGFRLTGRNMSPKSYGLLTLILCPFIDFEVHPSNCLYTYSFFWTSIGIDVECGPDFWEIEKSPGSPALQHVFPCTHFSAPGAWGSENQKLANVQFGL